MQLWEHYSILYRQLRSREADREAVEMSLPELAERLRCTERNVKLLLHRMREQGWIAWEPGRGRGRRSKLRLLADPAQLIEAEASEQLRSGQLVQLAKLLRHESLTPESQSGLLRMLQRSMQLSGSSGSREVLRFPAYRLPGGLDPAYVTRRTELHLVRQLFNTLVVYDPAGSEYGAGLAHHWESDEGGWTFYLQKGVRFHDGSAFTAKDAAATLSRLQAAGPYQGLFGVICGIAAEGEYRLRLELDRPVPWLLSLLASTAASIVPAERTEDYAVRPVGTGPYRLDVREERLLALEAHRDYYLRPAQLDRIEMWCFPELYEHQGQSRPELGGMNFQHYGYGALDKERWRDSRRTDRGCKYLVVNQAKPGPMREEGCRELLRMLLQEHAVSRDLGGNRGPAASRLILYDEEAGLEQPRLASASSEGMSFTTLTLAVYEGGGHEADAAWLAEKLQAAGVKLELRITAYEHMAADSTLVWADLLLLELPVDDDTEWTLLTLLCEPQSPLLRAAHPVTACSVRERLASLRSIPSRAERLKALRQAEALLLEAGTVLPWYRWLQTASFPPELQGVRISSLGWVQYRDLWYK